MELDDSIKKFKDIANLCSQTLPGSSSENAQIATWLEELKTLKQKFVVQGPHSGLSPIVGVSICILTYNVLFYNKIAVKNIREFTKFIPYEIIFFDNGSDDGSVEWLQDQGLKVIKNDRGEHFRHGSVLNYLVRHVAKYPITCTLCSDAFPVSPEWLSPAFYLNDKVMLSGISRGYGRITKDYVCPSYLFGWTDWLKNHSFLDNWPNTDTGEQLTRDCLDEGKEIKTFPFNAETFDGRFSAKNCDYNGWTWHVWWGGRSQTVKTAAGVEFEHGYHEFMIEYLRKKHNLDF
jgi:glycosyltransferase involved in cell wall biosynthesis